jgi:hypothetical protein
MTRTVYQIDVDRVVITGAGAESLGAGELRALIELAVARDVANATLPAGRTMRAAVQVSTSSLTTGGGPAVANAVAAGVTRAITGGSSRG